jgi:hypothetical protein
MAHGHKEGHNGHQNIPTGSERVRSGFDRRRNWGDSIENVYRRIDHRLSELVQQGTARGRELSEEAEQYAGNHPLPLMALCLAAGVVIGLWIGTSKGDE